MTKALFRFLGTLHGLVGLVTLAGIFYLAFRGGLSSSVTRVFYSDPVGTIGGIAVICSLIACMTATWLRPQRAALFAWLAAFLYIGTAVLGAFLQFGGSPFGNLLSSFYYSAAVRLVGALIVTVLAGQLEQRSNNSFKPKPLRGSA